MIERNKTVEGEYKEVEDKVRCAVKVTITESGKLSFDVEGTDQNLITIEGLLKYGQVHAEYIWKQQLGK